MSLSSARARPHHFALSTLVGVLATACVVPSDATQQLEVTWKVAQAGDAPDACPGPPYNQVFVRARYYPLGNGRLSPDFTPGRLFTFGPFDCAAGHATVELGIGDSSTCDGGFKCDLSSGAYGVDLYFSEPSGTAIDHGISSLNVVSLSKGPQKTAFTFYPHAGFAVVTWTLQASDNRTRRSCWGGNAAGVDHVRVSVRQTGKLVDGREVPVTDAPTITHTAPCVNAPFEADNLGLGDCPDQDAVNEGQSYNGNGLRRDAVTGGCYKAPGWDLMNSYAFYSDGGAAIGPLAPGYYSATVEALSSGAVVGTAMTAGHSPSGDPGQGECEVRPFFDGFALCGYSVPLTTR
jgi:hypothetical protein